MLSLHEYCDMNGLNYNTTYQGIYQSDKKGLPEYIIKQKKTYFIDMVLLGKKLDTDHSAWTFATTYTYWWLTDWIGMNHIDIARALAERSKKYNSVLSWANFIGKDLFNIPQTSIYNNERTMLQDFVVYGTAMCLAYYRDNY